MSLRKIDIIESIYEEFDISKKDCFRNSSIHFHWCFSGA